jgi:hypothetical protein
MEFQIWPFLATGNLQYDQTLDLAINSFSLLAQSG